MVKNVVKLTEATQTKIFSNQFEKNKDYVETSEVYCKPKKKMIDIRRGVRLSLPVEWNINLSEFDEAVHNAVCSLMEAGVMDFTTEQLYRVISGDENKQLSSPQMRKSIESSLLSMRLAIVTINFEDEARNFDLECMDDNGNKIVKLSDNILSLTEVVIRLANGKEVNAYHISSTPPLYIYAKVKKQLDMLSLSHLNMPLKITDDNIRLREFLLGRILLIKGKTRDDGELKKGYKNCDVIKLDTIYKAFELTVNDSSTRKNRQRIKEKCEKLFNYWKDSTDLLFNWSFDGDCYKLEVNVDNLT